MQKSPGGFGLKDLKVTKFVSQIFFLMIFFTMVFGRWGR